MKKKHCFRLIPIKLLKTLKFSYRELKNNLQIVRHTLKSHFNFQEEFNMELSIIIENKEESVCVMFWKAAGLLYFCLYRVDKVRRIY